MATFKRFFYHGCLVGLFTIALMACQRANNPVPPLPETSVPTVPSTALPTETLPPPTATPVPLAALVNGDAILLQEYQAGLNSYQAAYGTNLATGWEKAVLDDQIDELVLAQGARAAGFVIDDGTLQARIDTLAGEMGGPQALSDYIRAQSWNEEIFRALLARSIAAAWMRDQIAASVPQSAEQVHARQILLYNSGDANAVLALLNAGADFKTLARQYDPVAGGDLGWFPRGYLLDTTLDETLFSLQPGQYSDVVQTAAGYHIFSVIEKDDAYPLSPTARRVLQEKALKDWLQRQRSQSQIQVLIP